MHLSLNALAHILDDSKRKPLKGLAVSLFFMSAADTWAEGMHVVMWKVCRAFRAGQWAARFLY
jgi:hypothetical protein